MHAGVACDGCGVAPILGVRYKCSVCKNFDYCEICEERLTHEHPFIKITRPDIVPVSIITGMEEGDHHHHGRGWRGGRGGCHRGMRGGHPWRHMAHDMLNMAKEYITQCGGEDEKHEECKSRSKWSEQRAVIVAKPSEVIEAVPG